MAKKSLINQINYIVVFVVLALIGQCSFVLAATENVSKKNIKPATKISIQSHMRTLGYRIGDITVQTLTVTTPQGYVFDKDSLPVIGANASPVELVKALIDSENSNKNTIHSIQLHWQHFRSSPEIRYYPLKPLTLKFTHEDKDPLSIAVSAGQIMVAPVIPTIMSGDAYKNLQADIPPALKSTSAQINYLLLLLLLSIACVTYLAWYFNWFNWQSNRLKPFRNAHREIKKLAQTQHNIEAMRILKKAFDGVASRAVSLETLPTLLQNKPWLNMRSSEINTFFIDSERTFFAGELPTQNFQQIRTLSRQLMQLESASI